MTTVSGNDNEIELELEEWELEYLRENCPLEFDMGGFPVVILVDGDGFRISLKSKLEDEANG